MQRVGVVDEAVCYGDVYAVDREAFWRLGGFNERALFAEDYPAIEGCVARIRFRIVRGRVLTTNRRFQKLGTAGWSGCSSRRCCIAGTMGTFLEDQGYWWVRLGETGE